MLGLNTGRHIVNERFGALAAGGLADQSLLLNLLHLVAIVAAHVSSALTLRGGRHLIVEGGESALATLVPG